MWQVLVLVVWQKEKMRKKEPDYQADGSKHTTDRLIFLEFDSIGGYHLYASGVANPSSLTMNLICTKV
jgi:hypothetical protein